MSLQISKFSIEEIDAYLDAKVKSFALLDDGGYPEKLGWLQGVFRSLLNGLITLDEVRNEINQTIAFEAVTGDDK